VAPAPTPTPSANPSPLGKTKRKVLPHWERPASSFDWTPLGGLRFANSRTLLGEASAGTIEAGVRAGWDDLQLGRGSAGLGLVLRAGGAGAGIASGVGNEKTQESSSTTISVYRGYAELGLNLFFKAFRDQLTVSRGGIRYNYREHVTIQDVAGANDAELRVLRWMTLGVATRYRHLFTTQFSDPLTVELDNWPHLGFHVAAPVDLYVDAGPGACYTQESYQSEVAAEGYVRYAMLKLRRPDFYHLGNLESRIKYTLQTDDAALGRYSTTRLPQDDLASPPSLSAPADTMSASLLFNVEISETRWAYWINYMVYDYGKRDSHSYSDVGIGAFFGYDL
jgi:hypothetical protein